MNIACPSCSGQLKVDQKGIRFCQFCGTDIGSAASRAWVETYLNQLSHHRSNLHWLIGMMTLMTLACAVISVRDRSVIVGLVPIFLFFGAIFLGMILGIRKDILNLKKMA